MYAVSAYFWAKIFSEFPSSLLTPVIFGAIVYYAIGFNPYEGKFPTFCKYISNFNYSNFLYVLVCILFLIYNASSGYALILGTIFSDKQLAVTLTPVLIIPFMLFAGFFVNQDNIPVWLIEFQYLSIFKYGYQALMLNEYQDLRLECQDYVNIQERCDPLTVFNSP